MLNHDDAELTCTIINRNTAHLFSNIPNIPFQTFYEILFENHSLCEKVISIKVVIIHQTHYEKSDWSRVFNQFTIACELDIINAISAADIAFIMSSSTSAWLLSPLEYSPQKQNG